MERSKKGLVIALDFKTKVRFAKVQNARYAIGNISKKEISKIIREFEEFEKLSYEKKRTKHEPTDSYFYLARQLVMCVMRSDNLNWYNHGGYMKMTALYLNVNVMNESESKCSILSEKLLHICSTNKNKSKNSIVNEPLWQKCFSDKNKLRSTKEDK